MTTPDYEDIINEIAWKIRPWVTVLDVMHIFRDMVRDYVTEFGQHNEAYWQWEKDYFNHIKELRKNKRLRNRDAGPPLRDWVWQEYPPLRKPDGKRYRTGTAGWTPPPLQEQNRIDRPAHPLPFSDSEIGIEHDESLTLAAKFAILAAFHDRVCVGFDAINPFPRNDITGVPYHEMVGDSKIPFDGAPFILQAIVNDVRKELTDRGLLPQPVLDTNPSAPDSTAAENDLLLAKLRNAISKVPNGKNAKADKILKKAKVA